MDRKLFLCFFAFAFSVPTTVFGQVIQGQGPKPTRAECDQARTLLEAGDHGTHSINTLVECGLEGAVTLANALRNARGETDSRYLRYLFRAVSYIQHPDILEAAMGVVLDRSAGQPARSMALLTVKWQYDVATTFPIDVTWETQLHGPISPECRSGWLVAEHETTYAMPAGFVGRIRETLEGVAADSTEAEHLRNLAACLLRMI